MTTTKVIMAIFISCYNKNAHYWETRNLSKINDLRLTPRLLFTIQRCNHSFYTRACVLSRHSKHHRHRVAPGRDSRIYIEAPNKVGTGSKLLNCFQQTAHIIIRQFTLGAVRSSAYSQHTISCRMHGQCRQLFAQFFEQIGKCDIFDFDICEIRSVFHCFFKIVPVKRNIIAMLGLFQQQFDFLPNRSCIHAVHNSISRIVLLDWEVFCLWNSANSSLEFIQSKNACLSM